MLERFAREQPGEPFRPTLQASCALLCYQKTASGLRNLHLIHHLLCPTTDSTLPDLPKPYSHPQ